MGWLIDPVLSNAVPWGGDPLFVAMRAANPTQISGQAVDYGSMFHTEYMEMKQGRTGLAPEKQAVVKDFEANGSDKETLRKLVKNILLLSLRKCLQKFINFYSLTLLLNSGEACKDETIKQMQWGPMFADLCYRKRVKLVNYPAGMKPIGIPGGLKGAANVPKEVAKSIVSRWVRFWKQEARAKKEADAAGDSESKGDQNKDEEEDLGDPVLKDELVRFEAWDEGKFSSFPI